MAAFCSMTETKGSYGDGIQNYHNVAPPDTGLDISAVISFNLQLTPLSWAPVNINLVALLLPITEKALLVWVALNTADRSLNLSSCVSPSILSSLFYIFH